MIEVTGKNYHQNNDATIISSMKNVESGVFFDNINRNKSVNYLSVNDRDNFYNFKSHISLSSNDTVIRNRFLNKIGIGINKNNNKMQQQQKPRYRYERANRHYENLKFNNKYGLEEEHNMPMQQENHHEKNSTINHNKEISNNDQHHHQQQHKQNTTQKQKRVVNFNNKVDVIPIPMRNEYSSRISKHLWHNSYELYEMVLRNQEEFRHEGWNWRNVLEDDEMYVCTATGDKIHPIHIHLMNECKIEEEEPTLFV